MMITQHPRRRVPAHRFAALALVAVLGLAGCDSNDPEDPAERELDQVRQATAAFDDFNTGTTDVWVINQEFSLWTLHAWIVLDNPDGVFTPTNPQVP